MKVGLTFTQHFLAECDETLAKTLFGNVGNLIAFRISTEDLPLLGRKFSIAGSTLSNLHQLDNLNLQNRSSIECAGS